MSGVRDALCRSDAFPFGKCKIKICGLKRPEDIRAVNDTKPDYCGFVIEVPKSSRCVSREQVEKYLTPLTDNLLLGVIAEFSEGMVVREEDKEFIAQVYSYCFIGIMIDWIKDGMKQDPETLVERFTLVIQDDIRMALNRFRKDKPL